MKVIGQFADKPTRDQSSRGLVNSCTGRFTTGHLVDSEFVNITFGAIIYSKFYVKPFRELTSPRIVQSASYPVRKMTSSAVPDSTDC